MSYFHICLISFFFLFRSTVGSLSAFSRVVCYEYHSLEKGVRDEIGPIGYRVMSGGIECCCIL